MIQIAELLQLLALQVLVHIYHDGVPVLGDDEESNGSAAKGQ